MILIELDGFGIEEQTESIKAALEVVGAEVEVAHGAQAEHYWELRRRGRSAEPNSYRAGEDVAVPKSQLLTIFAGLTEVAAAADISITAIAHAGDGNIHPHISRPVIAGEDPDILPPDMVEAEDQLVLLARKLGGVITGEHGVGQVKRKWLDLELEPANRALQHAIKDILDPHHLLNPGKAI